MILNSLNILCIFIKDLRIKFGHLSLRIEWLEVGTSFESNINWFTILQWNGIEIIFEITIGIPCQTHIKVASNSPDGMK